jgi:hypothetical protein
MQPSDISKGYGKMKNLLFLTAAIISMNSYADVSTSAVMQVNDSCRAGHKCELKCDQGLEIINNTNALQVYYYTYLFCPKAETEACEVLTGKKYLSPNQKWNNAHTAIINPFFQYSAKWEMECSTQISGPENSRTSNTYFVNVH